MTRQLLLGIVLGVLITCAWTYAVREDEVAQAYRTCSRLLQAATKELSQGEGVTPYYEKQLLARCLYAKAGIIEGRR